MASGYLTEDGKDLDDRFQPKGDYVTTINGQTGNVKVDTTTPIATSDVIGGIKPATNWIKVRSGGGNISNYSYTATRNCYIVAYNNGGTNNMTVNAFVNGVQIFHDYGHHNDGNNSYPMFFLMKGQTLSLSQGSSNLHVSVLYLE